MVKQIIQILKSLSCTKKLRSTNVGIGSSYSSTAYVSGEGSKENKNKEENIVDTFSFFLLL